MEQQKIMAHGLTLSDLHLFTRRSGMTDLIQILPADIAAIKYLVLNGDIFDFRWTTLADTGQAVARAVDCIVDLMAYNPDLEIHYVLGNHDCHHEFIVQLRWLSINEPLFFFYPYYFQMRDMLFLHGDCANGYIKHEQLIGLRKSWMNVEIGPDFQVAVYQMADKIGITKLFHYLYFPKREVVKRVLYYLSSLPQGMPIGIKEIYLGHSHLPFNGYKYNNYCFHNTGSGIKGMTLNPIYFMAEISQ
jgi:hypothetical protein